MDGIISPHLVSLAGLAIGLAFGFVVWRSDWCVMGAVSDIVLIGDWRRMRSWLLAIATAILGTQALVLAGVLAAAGSGGPASQASWIGGIVGGLAFGYGMTRTGGCISKNLVRLGGGSLRALVVLMVVAVTALATLTWPPLLLEWIDAADRPAVEASQADLPALLGIGASGQALLAVLIAGGLAWFCLKDRRFRASRPLLLAGLTLGLLVPLSWLAAASQAGPDGLLALAALNFVGASMSTLGFLTAASPVLSFGVALFGGTILGALAGAGADGRLRLEGFAGAQDLRSNLGGATLMGVGGAIAGGCTVGQGLTGVSTLGLASVVAALAIVLGALAGVRTLEAGGLRGAFRALAGG
ncbi:MAG: YeeE/YedE family protein [Geminicoccaceae bacterium]|nr:YeeE/YedE family protein [Geminicoccaceae bacterium]